MQSAATKDFRGVRQALKGPRECVRNMRAQAPPCPEPPLNPVSDYAIPAGARSMRRILVPFLTCILFVTPCAAQEFSEVDRVEYRDFVPTGNGRLGRHLAVAGHQLLATAPQASSAPYA